MFEVIDYSHGAYEYFRYILRILFFERIKEGPETVFPIFYRASKSPYRQFSLL